MVTISKGPLLYLVILIGIYFFSVKPNIMEPLQYSASSLERMEKATVTRHFFEQRKEEALSYLPPNCASCHTLVGIEARQQFGLNSLIFPITAMSEDKFISYVRGQREGINTVMPKYSPEVIPDVELRRIYRSARYPILE